MASNRMISTGIWSDERFTELSAAAQLIYLRLVTGDDTTTAGASEVRIKRLAVDTNLERQEVEQAIAELVESDLVRRYDGWLWLPNWIKYQVHGAGFIKSARRASKGMPDALRKAIGRAIDAHVGPQRGGDLNPHDAEDRTGNHPTSRDYHEPPPEAPASLPSASPDPLGGVQDQDQDQDPPLRGEGPSGTGDESAPSGPRGPTASDGAKDNGQGPPLKENGRVDLEAIAADAPPAIAAAIKRARARVLADGEEG